MALGQRVDQAKRQQMRQMAGCGKHFIVVANLHVLDIRTQRRPQPMHQCQGGRVGVGQRRQYHLMSAEQRTLRGGDSALLGTGDRVPRDETSGHATEDVACTAHDVTLRAADIGEHRIAQVERSQLRQQLFHRQDRHGQLDHISIGAGLLQRFGTIIDHTQFDRQLTGTGVQIETDDLATQFQLPQPLGERTTDQTEADDHQPTNEGFARNGCPGFAHWASTLCNASMKRAFSASVPIDTRRKVGMP